MLVTSRPRPFNLRCEHRELPAGLTVLEMVETSGIDPAVREWVHVRLGDDPEPLDRRYWHRVKPRAGALVHVAVVPRGGAGTLNTVLSVAVVAAALAAFTLAAPVSVPLAAALSVGISVGGMLAVNALVPPPGPKLAESSPTSPSTYSLTGGGNRARPFESIPRVLGFHRMAPDLAAPWTTDLEGNDQYLCGLLSWGYGPLEISELRIGDTPIEDYEGVQLETVPGTPGEVASLRLYPNVIIPLTVQVKLTKAGGWTSRTTADDTDEAVIELALPTGGIQYGKKTQDRIGVTVRFEVDVEPVGGTRFPFTAHEIKAKTTSAKRSTVRVVFAARGQYVLHVRRITPDIDPDDNEENRIDESWWISLRSHRHETPVRMPGLCMTAIRIKASEQLSGTITDLTGLAKSIVHEWNPDTDGWDTVASNKPHALFRYILQGNGQKEPVPDDKLDLPQLEAWGDHCWKKGLTCNLVLDQAVSTWEALRMVAATGRAAPTCATGVWSVVVDWEKPYPAQLFTPRNSRGFKGRRLFVEMPHALRVRFVDGVTFEQAERIVYDDGFDANNATKFETIEFPGVTDPAQCHVLGRMRLAEARLRSESWEIEVDWQHLGTTRGDRVSVASDVTEWGADSFRIKRLNYTGNLLSSITLDGAAVLAPNLSYGIAIRGVDEQFVYPVRGGGVTDTVQLVDPIVLPPGLEEGDLATVGERGIETYDCLIQSITPGQDLSARLMLIPYAPGVFTADTEVIPPYASGRTRSAGVDRPLVLSVLSGETAGKRNADGSLHVQVVIALFDDGSRPTTVIAGVELRWREVDGGGPWRYTSFPADARELVIGDAEDGTSIEFAVRYQKRDGRAGPWTAVQRHFVDGPDILPPDVPALYVDGDRLSWNAPSPAPPDLAGYRLYWSTKAGEPLSAAQLFSEGLQTDTFIALGAVPDSAVEMLVVAVTTAGLQSLNPARALITPGSLPTRVEIGSTDFRERGWPGLMEGCTVDVAGDLVAIDTNRFLLPLTGRFLMPPDEPFLAAAWQSVIYDSTYAIPAIARDGDRIRLDLEYEGEWSVWYAWGTDALTQWPEEAPITELMWDYANANPELPFGQVIGAIPTSVAPPAGNLVYEDDVYEDGIYEAERAGIGLSTTGVRPWRLALSVRPGEILRIQLRASGGAGVRPRVVKFRLLLEGQEIEETFSNLIVQPEGTRLPLTKPFRRIDFLFGITRSDASLQGGSASYDTKDIVTGPIVRVVTTAGISITATTDWRVIGV